MATIFSFLLCFHRHSALTVTTGIVLVFYVLYEVAFSTILFVAFLCTCVVPVATVTAIIYCPFILCDEAFYDTAHKIQFAALYCPIKLMRMVGLPWFDDVSVEDSLLVQYRAEVKAIREEPVPLPRTRKRKLSGGWVRLQSESPLFSRLPLEIRRMIYREVVVDSSPHRHIIERCDPKENATESSLIGKRRFWGAGCVRRPLSKECSTLLDNTGAAFCLCYMGRGSHPKYSESRVDGRGALALAKTCRQIYVESIDLFYSKLYPYSWHTFSVRKLCGRHILKALLRLACKQEY